MEKILSIVLNVGATLTGTLEAWVLALMAIVLLIDLIFGIKRRQFLIAGLLLFIGLVGGYFWTSSMAQHQDVAGPYAWAFVVGFWFIFAAIFHILIVLALLRAPRR